MYEYDSILGLYSNQNFLNQKIKEKFNNKYVDVKIFTEPSTTDFSKFNYLVINLLDTNYKKQEIITMVSNIACKIIVLTPFKIQKKTFDEYNTFLKNLTKSNLNLGIILVPELLGEDVKYQEGNISHDLIMQSILSERIKIGDISKKLNLISVNKLVDEIVREIFSFGISGKKVLPIGFNKNSKTFAKKYLGVIEENIITKQESYDYQEIMPDVKKEISFSVNAAISKTKNYFTTQKVVIPEDNILNPITTSQSFLQKYFHLGRMLLLAVFIAIVTPAILIMISISSLFFASKVIVKNEQIGVGLINLSRSVSGLSTNLNFGIPFYLDINNLVYKTTSIATQLASLVQSVKNLSSKMLGETTYPLESYANDISANLDRIYTDISFIQSDVDETPGMLGKELRFYLDSHKISIGEIKGNIYNLKKFTSRLSDVLGTVTSKKYLILFQNNMEIRPTGGFIGSFALITFDKGRITEIIVNDVYSADGQLKGHIDPPEPIKKYLKEGSWYMRDANWDPDFVTSAQKIEWFLNKEIDQNVDGVISIDLHFVKSLLNVTGPINLTDFNKTITADNLYQTIQSEVEDDFFPGSIKKASFLTSLSRNLVNELKNLKKDSYTPLFKEIYKNLEGKHIQIYLHDQNAGGAISNMGYSGEINMNINCGLRCIYDKYQLVDANLGVNKSNLFIKRTQDLSLKINKEFVGHELFVTYANIAGPSLGPSAIYKNYSRLVLPKEAKVSGVRIYKTNGTYQDLDYDLFDVNQRRELGFYFELMPATSIRIQIVWNIKTSILNQGGEYKLLVKKQSGTDKDLLNINIESEDLSLTGKASSIYNTDLAKDYKARLFFKP